MATASVSTAPDCSICFESLKTPKVLPCGHTFCLCCIERYISVIRRTFPCPICKQTVQVPVGGAKMFTTNFILQTTKVRDKPKCSNHNKREVDYYCNNCNVGLCFKCIHVFKQHKDHETLDIECEETRNKAIEKLQSSQNIIQNRLNYLKQARSTLLESFEQAKSVCEDSCSKVTETTEKIVSDLRTSCKQIIKDIRKNLEENRSKVEDREMEITSDINVLESNMDSIISPSTKTTLNILQTLHRLIEIEKLGDSRIDYNLCIQYLQWVGKDFSLDIDQLGSVISKSSYLFLFDISDIQEDYTSYYSQNKFRYNNLVWSCIVIRFRGCALVQGILLQLLPADNPKLNSCFIDGQLSLLNIDDDSKSITETYSNKRLKSGEMWGMSYPITWSELTNKNNGYLNSTGRFMVKFDITQIRDIKFSQ